MRHLSNLVLAWALVTPALHASVSYGLGSATSSQSVPFDLGSSEEYQQGYTASVFEAAVTGPVVINSITFFDTKFGVPAQTTVAGGTYTIAFYLTSNAANNLSGTFASNEGTLLGTFFSGTLGGQMTTTSLTINGTPFTYDPTQGNLVMDVIAVLNPSPVGSGGFDIVSSSTQMGRVISGGIGGSGSSVQGGLVTTFGIATPEPSSTVLLCLGLAAIAAFRRR